jgi:hypothetical protein
MLMQELPFDVHSPEPRRARDLAATVLRTAGLALGALAERLTLVRAPPVTEPVIEYHADAGAPEGALYVNGQLVGHVLGVNRL